MEKNLSQQTANRIFKLISKNNEFLPGSQLPGEIEFSKRLGVSRATLREAIRMLVMQGVLDVRRGKGTFVAAKIHHLSNDYNLGKMQRVAARLKDLYEARLIYEPVIAAIACRRATDSEMVYMLKAGQECNDLIRAGKDRTLADQNFHQSIVYATHNEFLKQLISITNTAIQEVLIAYSEVLFGKDAIHDHEQIMRFLKYRDAEGAQQAMSIHIRNVISDINVNESEEPIFTETRKDR